MSVAAETPKVTDYDAIATAIRADIDATEPDIFKIMQNEMLAVLLVEDVCFVSTYNNSTKRHDGGIYIIVICSDTFAWACADGEAIRHDDILDVYVASRTMWGVTRWVSLRRNMRPMIQIEKRMRESGVWDSAMDDLPQRENTRSQDP